MTLKTSFNRLHKLDDYAVVLFPNAALIDNMARNLPVMDDARQGKILVVMAATDPYPPRAVFQRARVVFVSSRLTAPGCPRDTLIQGIRRSLEIQDRLLAEKPTPPPVDEEAAARVAAAYAKLPPATEADRKAFLNAFYDGGMCDGP